MTTITYLTHSIRTAKSNDRLLALKDLCLITGPSRPDRRSSSSPTSTRLARSSRQRAGIRR
jgi:hypothetical protein